MPCVPVVSVCSDNPREPIAQAKLLFGYRSLTGNVKNALEYYCHCLSVWSPWEKKCN